MKLVAMFFAAGLFLASGGVAIAGDTLGLYVGGAVSHADVSLNQSASYFYSPIDLHHTGWKVMLGIRPVRIVAVELEYLDFGRTSYGGNAAPPTEGPIYLTAATHTKAAAAFAVLYAPIPIPTLDVFGKLGAARTQFDSNGEFFDIFCPLKSIDPACPFFANRITETDLAYGGGVQVRFGAAALRAEYERIDATFGAPYMYSLGITWTFL